MISEMKTLLMVNTLENVLIDPGYDIECSSGIEIARKRFRNGY